MTESYHSESQGHIAGRTRSSTVPPSHPPPTGLNSAGLSFLVAEKEALAVIPARITQNCWTFPETRYSSTSPQIKKIGMNSNHQFATTSHQKRQPGISLSTYVMAANPNYP